MKVQMPPRGILLLILFGILWTGCLDVEFFTEVAADGSCERTVTVKGDSSDIYASRFPIPKDSTWDINLVMEDQDNYVYTARKQFADIHELNQEFVVEDSNIVAISMHASLKKRFHWFFSSLKYREVYEVNHPVNEVPLTEYLTEDEMYLYIGQRLNGDQEEDETEAALLDDLEERFNTWYAHNVFEAFYKPFTTGVAEMGHDILTPEFLASKKENLFEEILDSSVGSDIESWIELFEKVLGTPAVRQVVEDNPRPFQLLEAQMALHEELALSDFSTSVRLPGLIVETNAGTLEGSRAAWNDIGSYLICTQYETAAKSRMINWGITIVNAVILVLLLAGLIMRAIMLRHV